MKQHNSAPACAAAPAKNAVLACKDVPYNMSETPNIPANYYCSSFTAMSMGRGAAFPKALVHNGLYHIACLGIIESFRLAKTLKVIQSMDLRETFCNYHVGVLSLGRELKHITFVISYLIILHTYTIQYFV